MTQQALFPRHDLNIYCLHTEHSSGVSEFVNGPAVLKPKTHAHTPLCGRTLLITPL